ncbi:MAG: DUF3149 domain-containing protein [Alteromonadaceae bacterium]|nr:DUF3149 domain-containing protein [Alteromonadaceae bacterium]
MKFFEMLVNDPIVLSAITGLIILLGIGAYYIYYFISHIQNDK